jgi:hypothetical protein
MSLAMIQNGSRVKEVIVLSNAVYQSYLGKYFLGQTDLITLTGGYNAWGGLINPSDSNVNMFLNAYTITNFSEQTLTAEGWLSSILPGKAKVSMSFAAGNQSIAPPPMPKVQIKSAGFVSNKPAGGIYTFVRRVEPEVTLTKHDFQGMYIIPPGSSFVLYFLSPGIDQVQVRIAFGWWEEKV